MTGPPWLAAVLAAVMILTAACSASRLVVARRRALATEADADALHAVMGTAMAGMLLPQLNLLPATAWAVIFAVAAAWFAGRALRAPGASKPGRPGCFPVPHLIECVAMLYMLLWAHGAQHGTGMAMPGMGASPGSSSDFPAFAVVLTLFMIGYIMWTTDQLASLARTRATPAGRGRALEYESLATDPGAGQTADASGSPGGPGTSRTGHEDPAGRCSPPGSPRRARSPWASP